MGSVAQQQVFSVTANSFQADVVERSASTPVVLLFWAQQSPQAAQARRQLETLVGRYGDKVALGLVDVAADQALAQHLRVQALPSLRVVDKGQIVQQLDGPQPERVLRTLLDKLTLSAAELVKAQLDQYLQQGDLRAAERFLRQALREEPNNPHFRVELADVLARQGSLANARKVLATVAADAAERERPQTRLELAEEAADLPTQSEIQAALEQDGDNLGAHLQLAIVAAANGALETALEHALHILRVDRKFEEDIGRRTLLRIFTVAGKGSELASRYRRRMFNLMH